MRARLVLVAAAVLLLLCSVAALADPTPQYFNIPDAYNASTGIATAPDGTVWFATNPPASGRPSLGRLIPGQASPGTANGMAIFPTPTQPGTGCCANSTRSVAFDPAGNRVWFVQSDGIVGWADPAAVSPGTSAGMADKLLTGAGDLSDIVVDPRSGLAWFTEHSAYNVSPYPGNRIGSIDSSLNVTELNNIALQGGRVTLDSLRYDAKPAGIALDRDGRPWFAEAEPGNPGWRIGTPNGADYTEYLVQPCAPGAPCSGSYTGTGITDVAVAQDGAIWFTNQLRNEVGRLDVAGGTFTNYSLPGIDAGLAGGQARAISVAQDGTLWVAEYGGYTYANANAIVKIVPSQPSPTVTVYHLGAGKFPFGVAPDTRGNVWFALGTNIAPGLIGRLAGVVGAAGGGGAGDGGRVVRATSVGRARAGTPSVSGTNVSVDQLCVGPPQDPCSLVYILSAHEYVTGFPHSRSASASAARARGRRRGKPKPLILGRKSLTLHGGQRKRVTISLNATGRRLLRRTGRLTVYFTVTQKGSDGKPPRRIKAVKLTFKARRRRGRR